MEDLQKRIEKLESHERITGVILGLLVGYFLLDSFLIKISDHAIMAIHKEFTDTLYKMRNATLRDILDSEGLGVFKWIDDDCEQNFSSLLEIDNIIKTILDLEDNGYLTIESAEPNNFPDLSKNFLPKSEAEKNHLIFTQEWLNKFYNKKLKINISLIGFIEDGYQTNNQRKEKRSFVTQIILATISSVLALVSLYYTYQSNERNNKEFLLRNRPYLVITLVGFGDKNSENGAKYKYVVKNVGTLSAKITTDSNVTCHNDGRSSQITSNPILIGNGEFGTFSFNTRNIQGNTVCDISINYTGPIESSESSPYSSNYSFSIPASTTELFLIDANMR